MVYLTCWRFSTHPCKGIITKSTSQLPFAGTIKQRKKALSEGEEKRPLFGRDVGGRAWKCLFTSDGTWELRRNKVLLQKLLYYAWIPDGNYYQKSLMSKEYCQMKANYLHHQYIWSKKKGTSFSFKKLSFKNQCSHLQWDKCRMWL